MGVNASVTSRAKPKAKQPDATVVCLFVLLIAERLANRLHAKAILRVFLLQIQKQKQNKEREISPKILGCGV